MQKIAFLLDYENFTCSPDGLERIFVDFSQRGTLVVKRAYADWVRFAGHRQHLLANQVEMIELACASKGKNSADIRLVVDAMELLFTKPYINTFVVASADADFLPLLSRLKEYNKNTIVVASSSNTQAYMRTHCDEFVNGDIYLSRGKAKPKAIALPAIPLPAPPKIQTPTHEQIVEIQSLVLEVWCIQGFDRPFELAALGYQLKKMTPGINWRDYGFKGLKPMVAFLVTNGFLRIELTKGSMERIYLRQPANHAFKNEAAATGLLETFQAQTKGELSTTEAGIASLIQSQVRERVRWDYLRNILRLIRPKLLSDIKSDDAFLKILQSLDAAGLIELTYDPSQATYYVSPTQSDLCLPSIPNETVTTKAELVSEWKQPKLFE